jgi:hypothetical protein
VQAVQDLLAGRAAPDLLVELVQLGPRVRRAPQAGQARPARREPRVLQERLVRPALQVRLGRPAGQDYRATLVVAA